jgi:hypothetical protein
MYCSSARKPKSTAGEAAMTLDEIINAVRPVAADGSRSTKKRIQALWASTKIARDTGATDVIRRAFMTLAVEANLLDRRGRWTGSDVAEHVRRYGREDVEHVVTWALRGWNPFEKGPLR